MSALSSDTTLEPLARVLYALEMAGFEVGEVSQATLDAAELGQSFALSLTLSARSELALGFDPTAAYFEIQVQLADGYTQEAVVMAALRLNHDMERRSRRFSLEPYSGAVVLSDVLPWQEASADELALCVCDLIVKMGELEDLELLDDDAPTESVQAADATPMALAMRG